MKEKLICTIIVMTVICIAACAGPTRVERDYGTSHKLAIFNQTLDPKAESNLNAVTGLNAQAEQIVMDKYIKSFERSPDKAPVYAITVGGLK